MILYGFAFLGAQIVYLCAAYVRANQDHIHFPIFHLYILRMLTTPQLSNMLHDNRHQFTIFHNRLQHLRYGMFVEHPFFLTFYGQANINAAAFRGGEFSGQTIFR